jgi:hypothetical protein
MSTKPECEKAIRQLCQQWAKEKGINISTENDPGFSTFRIWLEERGFSSYLNFRSVAGPIYDAEMWFDEEMKQTWRR